MKELRLQLLSLITLLTIGAAQASTASALDPELHTALKAKQGHYQVRTQHLCEQKPCYTNRLILESSPYLLQHAHNPIDWQAWTQAALDLAKQQNKPVFLSIGYAACHWCHVMEEESFDDTEVAELLNANFIPIKVDREQRPDIDEFYANAMLHFQGTYGWPMTLFLTPDGQAFHAGGYYTKEEFLSLLTHMTTRWNTKQEQLISESQALLKKIQGLSQVGSDTGRLDDSIRLKALADIRSIHDLFQGGFGEGSKFPRESWLLLLLDDYPNNPQAENSYTALTNTLTHIARGGLRDHLGGGFHRYTTDPDWKTPHFEKMLYTQALLASLYLQTSRIEPNHEFTEVAEETLDFMLATLQSPTGGFYASLDADTVEGEGYYYLWNLAQWNAPLSAQEFAFSRDFYDIDEHGEMGNGENVLRTPVALADFAKTSGHSLQAARQLLSASRDKLLRVRAQRSPPALDKKIIMSWNSIAIEAFATGAMILKNERYHEVAAQTADFIWDKLRHDQQFNRVFIDGDSEQAAQLEDYAWYLSALISLYDVDGNMKWLRRADSVANSLQDHFLDKEQGGLFQTSGTDLTSLPIRLKTAQDRTLPSSNAIAAQALIKLSRRSGNGSYMQLADNILTTFSAEARKNPSAYSNLLIASHQRQQASRLLPAYAAKGNIRIDANLIPKSDQHYDLQVAIQLRDDWHINANTPLDENLIPTQLQLEEPSDWIIQSIEYPKYDTVILGFSKKPLAVHQGKMIIKAELRRRETSRNPALELGLQACSNTLCLPPEQLRIIPATETAD